MTYSSFYTADPSPRAAWRLAVLMGANSRTYKFALGDALLGCAAQGEREVPLAELAASFAMGLVGHAPHAPQAPQGTTSGANDLLTIVAEAAEESRRLGRPTERLLDASVRSIPRMVLQKFHNLGGAQLPHHFYEMAGSGRTRVVRLTPELLRLAQSDQAAGLRAELSARWSIVESSFATRIGRSLIDEGVSVDWPTLTLTDRRRRRSVANVQTALVGFQHGRCLLCDHVISPGDKTAVDHVFPFALMQRFGSVGGWHGPDLDAVWNLAPAHATCNGTKSDRLPDGWELERLARRNEAITSSPYPLRTTLRRTLASAGGRRIPSWRDFLHEVQKLCT
ncbi:HNH endonuclease [Streptomyces sp. ODS28]|uniref:HNH endonuclease n=1 Tax=Streptomyces sp. ODS28 TaxID=3136688 RepID=UPI0031EA93D4